jgi:hypothetical protein
MQTASKRPLLFATQRCEGKLLARFRARWGHEGCVVLLLVSAVTWCDCAAMWVLPIHPDDRLTQGLRICESKSTALWSSSNLRPRWGPRRPRDGFQNSLKTFSDGPDPPETLHCGSHNQHKRRSVLALGLPASNSEKAG